MTDEKIERICTAQEENQESEDTTLAKAPPSPSTQEPWTLKGTSYGWWAHFDLTTVCWTHLWIFVKKSS